MGDEGRPEKPYADHGQPSKHAIFLGNSGASTRFGTEGSEVQILSPRPFF